MQGQAYPALPPWCPAGPGLSLSWASPPALEGRQGETMVCFPQGGWEGAAEVGVREGCPGLRTAHLLQLQLGIVTVAVGSYKSQLHKIQELSAAAEMPRVTESEIPTLPFLFLVLSQTCISHPPFPARKGFACTENCITFMEHRVTAKTDTCTKPLLLHPLCQLSAPKHLLEVLRGSIGIHRASQAAPGQGMAALCLCFTLLTQQDTGQGS